MWRDPFTALLPLLIGAVMAAERDPDWRAAIDRLRLESNDVLREIWAAKRRGLEDPDDDEGDSPTAPTDG